MELVETDRRSWFKSLLPLFAAFLILCFHRNAVPAQDTARVDTASWLIVGNSTASWDSLDRARQLHLSGEGKLALAVLENISRDSTITDPQFHHSRRELMAFVLYSAGEHQRAFDTLQNMLLHFAERSQAELGLERERSRSMIDSLARSIEEVQVQAISNEAKFQNGKEQDRLIAAGVIVLLLILVVLQFFRSKRIKPIAQQEPDSIVARTTDRPATVPPLKLTIQRRPPEQGLIHSHLTLISDRLNKGETVEAAAHVGVLSRFVRMNDEARNDLLPAQQAIAYLRQFLKLASLRSSQKLRYSVEADRVLLDRDLLIPIRRSASLLSDLLDQMVDLKGPSLSCRLVLQPETARPIMLIGLPKDAKISIPAIEGLNITSQDVSSMELEVSWPDLQPA